MDSIFNLIPTLYLLFILGLFTFLLIRGVTHSFVLCFLAAALVEMIVQLGYFAIASLPGGAAANSGYYPILRVFGTLGTICFGIAFLLLGKFLLPQKPAA